MEMIGKGAEANIYLQEGRVIKERISKAYRVKELDEALRKTRTKREAKLISLARRAGVPTPFILDVNNPDTTVEMSFVRGIQVKKLLNKASKKDRERICREIGRSAGKLHGNNIIHGDLTTSNMILADNRIYFIDFGLGEVSEAVEDKGVDLLVFKKSLRSTHYKFENECFKAFVNGYSKEYRACKNVLERLKIIELRGRYFAERF
ncbi:MAG: KEOPS complex kinase/ATPase Bud32 [Methanobacteriota archaeon]